ncbi:centrosomal protein 43-like [Daphnia pulex]|uniref:centrosomal protein 43-like n=1 Tax=Daphnia pulex TaxID=6669 RepID=UPI001EDE9C61|nr:centrosomal protein 43-like [Daphnia pulex]
MSTEEDPELRDLIAKTLENNGVLGKLRAQLRASTFLALDQQEDPKVTFPNSNVAVQQFASSKNGAVTMSLVRDFLTSFNMQFTLAVFDPETCEGVSYKNMSRSNLASELGLENVNPDVPLLHALVANSIKEQNPAVSGTNTEKKLTSTSIELIEAKLGNLKVQKNDDYDEDFQSSSESSVSTPKNENKEASVEEDLDVSASDLLASQSSNAADTVDKSTSNSSLGIADHVEKL